MYIPINICTCRWVKIDKKMNKSGAGTNLAKPLSDREKWLMNAFKFLKGNVVYKVHRVPANPIRPDAVSYFDIVYLVNVW